MSEWSVFDEKIKSLSSKARDIEGLKNKPNIPELTRTLLIETLTKNINDELAQVEGELKDFVEKKSKESTVASRDLEKKSSDSSDEEVRRRVDDALKAFTTAQDKKTQLQREVREALEERKRFERLTDSQKLLQFQYKKKPAETEVKRAVREAVEENERFERLTDSQKILEIQRRLNGKKHNAVGGKSRTHAPRKPTRKLKKGKKGTRKLKKGKKGTRGKK